MSTATANLAMKPRSLLLIFGGMTLSFALILGVMLATVGPDPKPRRKTTRSHIVEQTSAPRPTTRPAPPAQWQQSRQVSKGTTAMHVTEEVNWSLMDFIVMGTMLTMTGILILFIHKKAERPITRRLLFVSAVLFFVLIWVELAVGIFGTPFAGN